MTSIVESPYLWSTPGRFSRAIVKGDHNNFAPRLGFAYSASPKFTIRSGGGIFYARREQNQGVTQIAANIPNTPTVLFPTVSASTTITPPETISSPHCSLESTRTSPASLRLTPSATTRARRPLPMCPIPTSRNGISACSMHCRRT